MVRTLRAFVGGECQPILRFGAGKITGLESRVPLLGESQRVNGVNVVRSLSEHVQRQRFKSGRLSSLALDFQ